LITTDDGNFLFLKSNELKQLKKGKLESEGLYDRLHDKGIIITSDNIENIIEKTSLKYSFLNNGTSLHIMILTHRCNMACSYCFASAKNMDENYENADMREETAQKIVEFILKSPSRAATFEFQGGEPLIKFNLIKKIVKQANELNKKYKKDIKFALVTNLTLMTKEKANWLIDNNVSICTSLDGPKKVHDKNRYIQGAVNKKQVGTYEKVTSWIKKINEIYIEKNINRQVNGLMTITSYSLNYPKEIIDEYLKYNMNYVNIRALTFVGRAVEKNSLCYTKENFLRYFEKSLKYIEYLKTEKKIIVTERIVELYKKKIIENTPGYHTEYESPCGAVTGQITYFIDGKIYTCNEAMGKDEFEIGDVFVDEWSEVFKRSETSKAILNSMLEQNVICDRCAYKPYCGTCMVENYSRDNKFNFYPLNTQKHFETIYHANKIFDEILEK